ncbi:MAG: zf-HC2 domain-containing protein [Candidatus Magnetominusculus sp. LBB02]|nr:zf-HC2 domain-containing protein [Candidatus Magnetominusculus sp. LBB02]
MHSGHDDIKDMLHAYLHGTLSKDNAARVMGHLEQCDECAGEFCIAEALLKIEAPDPGDVYFNNLTNVVMAAARAKNTPKGFNLWQYLLRPAALTAAASLSLIIYLFIFNHGNFHSVQTANTSHTYTVSDILASDDMLASLEEEYGDDSSSDDSNVEDLL